ncbi:putative acyl transferase acyl hydrolase lysophospholipase [Ceratocystis lukuohia]|uniref:Acyl transferase acyl hydrolase lysophospholipase n=1 Tax=Ceratocystis lukuohia TaxID=2019550 RepID=A0ABR4MCV2_9PEZI
MASTTWPGLSSQPLGILSIDGGGVRGLSSLLILERIMQEIKELENLSEVPRPCDIFELIGGTSAGGIIAIMLGRLEMTVGESIIAYQKLAETAFVSNWENSIQKSSGIFPAAELENAIKQTIRENCTEASCAQKRERGMPTNNTCPHEDLLFRDESCTKTAVLAITKVNVEATPTLFTTDDESAGLSGCKIWEVARATSATTFDPIDLGRDRITFIDASFGQKNPCEAVLKQAEKRFPGREMIVVSIGTGLSDVVEIPNAGSSATSALKEIATTSKAAELRLHKRLVHAGQYFHFNVENGLQDLTLSDWDRMNEISVHTRNYLDEKQHAISAFADVVINGPAQPELQDSHTPIHYIPFHENDNFVGRQQLLSTLDDKLFGRPGFQHVALVGLGGMGKTQIALKLAHTVKKNRPDYSVFWLTVASMAAFGDACKKLAEELNIEATKDEDPKMLVKHHLESTKAGKWLLVLDNADNIEVFNATMENGIRYFLPQSDDGRILFTTRFRRVAQLAIKDNSNVMTVQEMPSEDLAVILERGEQDLNNGSQQRDEVLIKEVLEELGHLPLAVAQAADYMLTNGVSISEYLDLLRTTENDKIKLLEHRNSDEAHYEASQGAVATTWLITFRQIQKASSPAATLLAFIANIDSKAIPKSIFPQFETKQQMTHAIGVLLSYDLLRKRQTPDLFDMNSLVHFTAQLWFRSLETANEQRKVILDHVTSLFPDKQWKIGHTAGTYLPHGLRIFNAEKAKPTGPYELAFKIGKCLLRSSNIAEAIEMFEYIVGRLRDDSPLPPLLLDSQHELTRAYMRSHRFDEAISIQQRLVDLRSKSGSIDDPLLLDCQYQLARTCCEAGQVERGISILEQVVATRERILSIEDPSLLLSQRQLAQEYCMDGRSEDEILLFERAVEMRKRELPTGHHSLLSCQSDLSQAYYRYGRIDKRISTLEDIVAAKEKTLLADDSSLVSSQDELMNEYLENGQISKRVSMLQNVVEMRGKVLSANSPLFLKARDDLACAYLDNEEPTKAIKIFEQVVCMKEKNLPPNDPSLLRSQMQLAKSYHASRELNSAIECLRGVVERQKESLSEDDRDRVEAERLLEQWIVTSAESSE